MAKLVQPRVSRIKMALFKYFKREAKEEKGIHLPAEYGLLSQMLPPIVIKEANQAVANFKGSVIHIFVQWTIRKRRK